MQRGSIAFDTNINEEIKMLKENKPPKIPI